MSAVLSEADPLGSGPRSCGYRKGLVRSDMADWRRFGRATDFSGRKMKGVIAKMTGCPMTRKGIVLVPGLHVTLHAKLVGSCHPHTTSTQSMRRGAKVGLQVSPLMPGSAS